MSKQVLHPRTEAINDKQKHQAKCARLTALAWLRATFPQAFESEKRISPLKIGIMTDILKYAPQAAAAGISKSKLREAVVLFTRRMDYLACLKAREMRINLQGEAVAEVTQEEAEQAALKIKKRIEKNLKNTRQPTRSSTPQRTTVEPLPVIPVMATEPSASKTVVVTHKSSRNYDPEAVLRLREKLGLVKRISVEDGGSDVVPSVKNESM